MITDLTVFSKFRDPINSRFVQPSSTSLTIKYSWQEFYWKSLLPILKWKDRYLYVVQVWCSDLSSSVWISISASGMVVLGYWHFSSFLFKLFKMGEMWYKMLFNFKFWRVLKLRYHKMPWEEVQIRYKDCQLTCCFSTIVVCP